MLVLLAEYVFFFFNFMTCWTDGSEIGQFQFIQPVQNGLYKLYLVTHYGYFFFGWNIRDLREWALLFLLTGVMTFANTSVTAKMSQKTTPPTKMLQIWLEYLTL